MSDRIRELFLFDIIVAIQKIKYVANKFDNGENLKFDFLHWDTMMKEFEIIGEAMNYCLKFELLDDNHLREKRKIVDFRNVLVHNYFGMDSDEVLNIAKSDKLNWLENMILERIDKIEINLKNELKEEMINENKHLEFVLKVLKGIKL